MIVQRPAVFAPRSVTSFDRAFDQLTRELFSPSRRQLELDASWREGALVLTADLPGVPAADIELSVADRALTVSVAAGEGRAAVRRSVQLGASLDADAVQARYLDGRLTVVVPELAKAAPRTIAIDVSRPAEPPKVLETDTAIETDTVAGVDAETAPS